jgi:serine protease Do
VADVKQFLNIATNAEKSRAVSVMVKRGEFVNYLVIRPSR